MPESAREAWDSKNGYDAGVIISETIPLTSRPKWAAGILRLVVKRSGLNHPSIEHVLCIAGDKSQWSKGHDAFSQVRANTLLYDEEGRPNLTVEEEAMATVLAIAELVAKVTYNATSPSDEFDDDSAAWIIALLRNFVEAWDGDAQFMEDAWQAATDLS